MRKLLIFCVVGSPLLFLGAVLTQRHEVYRFRKADVTSNRVWAGVIGLDRERPYGINFSHDDFELSLSTESAAKVWLSDEDAEFHLVQSKVFGVVYFETLTVWTTNND